MNAAQNYLYWRAWGAVTRANKGKPLPEWDQSELGINALPIVEVNDLRHAAHFVALGKDKSSKKFTNGDFDRVLCVFRLLANPLNLDARMEFDAYQRGEDPGQRKRLIVGIRDKAPEAYTQWVCSNHYGTKNWQTLGHDDLYRLNMTLDNRDPAWPGQDARLNALASEETKTTYEHGKELAEASFVADDNQPF